PHVSRPPRGWPRSRSPGRVARITPTRPYCRLTSLRGHRPRGRPGGVQSMRLEGKVAIVTGGAGGIGRAIVHAYVDEGAQVLVVDVNEQAGAALAGELGDSVHFLAADLSVEANASLIVTTAVEHFGRLDVLVNNAHASRQAPFVETTMADFDLSFGTGFWPVFWLMREARPHLAQTQGSVINFASGAGIRGNVH